MHAQFSIVPRSPCAIILIHPKGPCIYLLIGFNDYLGPLVNVEGATSISTILLVDVNVGSFSSYKSVPTPWTKHIKTTVRGAPSLGNPSCSKSDFSHPSLAVAVAVALPVAASSSCTSSFFSSLLGLHECWTMPWCILFPLNSFRFSFVCFS